MSPAAAILVGLAALAVALVGLSMYRNPVLRRVSVRNVVRRKGTTSLVLLGSKVATAIIVGSLAMGDTFERGADDWLYRQQGEIDHVVTQVDAEREREVYFPRNLATESISLQRLNAATRAFHGEALVDGVLAVIEEKAPVVKVDAASGQPILAEPSVMVLAVDWGELARFGSQPPALPRPARGEVLVSEPLARELELGVGDTVQVFADSKGYTFTVMEGVPEEGIPGWRREFWFFSDVPGTLLMRLDDGQVTFADGADQVNGVFVSNTGEALQGLLQGIDTPGEFDVESPKSDGLAGDSDAITFVFLAFSSFSIIAGIMLLVNIYGMLAEERRAEIGTLRALGGSALAKWSASTCTRGSCTVSGRLPWDC